MIAATNRERAALERGDGFRTDLYYRLVAHPWPGNVRQLSAAMRRIVILAPPDHAVAAEEIQLEDPGIAGTLIEELEQAERKRMVEALAQAGGSRSNAARALGMARTTLVTKMKRYGIR